MTWNNPFRASILALIALSACPAQGQKPMKNDRPAASPNQEQKAIKDARPTAAFRAEHKEVLKHLGHVHEWVGTLSAQEPAEQKKTALKVVSFFEKHIAPHAAWEERVLYPVVDRLAGEGPNAFTATMRHEHRIVGRWIAELRAESAKPAIDPAKFARRTDNLLGLLWAHFEEEDEILLPLIDKGMTKEQFEREVGGTRGAH